MWKKRDVAHSCTTWQVIVACAVLQSPTTAKLFNVTNARSNSTVNSSQRRPTVDDVIGKVTGQLADTPTYGLPTHGLVSSRTGELAGNQSSRHMEVFSTHTVNSAPVNSSHTRLVTQSTRHKWARNHCCGGESSVVVTTLLFSTRLTLAICRRQFTDVPAGSNVADFRCSMCTSA